MLDVLLFGATGYTGRLVAAALGRRKARFAVAGRDRSTLEAIARDTGAVEVAQASVGDIPALASAARDARVLLSCVGPFAELGETAIRAAREAGTHYLDSSGEAAWVATLADRWDAYARAAGLMIAPCLAFNEVPADVAATIAVEGLPGAALTITYALPSFASPGTVRSSVGILTSDGAWLRDGTWVRVATGELRRWAPLPPPLGPRPSFSAHMAEARLAPLHLDVSGVSTFLSTSTARMRAGKVLLPALRAGARARPSRALLEPLLLAASRRPDDGRALEARWTVMIEASAADRRRAVVVTGRDTYGLSAELLAAGALRLAGAAPGEGGVHAPVPAVGLTTLRGELTARGATISVFEPS